MRGYDLPMGNPNPGEKLYHFILMGHFLFLFSSIQDCVESKQMFNINFADDWIQTADLWFWKQPLYQLSPNH